MEQLFAVLVKHADFSDVISHTNININELLLVVVVLLDDKWFRVHVDLDFRAFDLLRYIFVLSVQELIALLHDLLVSLRVNHTDFALLVCHDVNMNIELLALEFSRG